MIILCQLLSLFLIVVFARILLSWFPIAPDGALSTVYGALYSVTEPVLGPIRRALPSLGPFDLSPIVVVIGVQIIQQTLC